MTIVYDATSWSITLESSIMLLNLSVVLLELLHSQTTLIIQNTVVTHDNDHMMIVICLQHRLQVTSMNYSNTPGSVFTALHFLCKLQIGPARLDCLASYRHSLLGTLKCCEYRPYMNIGHYGINFPSKMFYTNVPAKGFMKVLKGKSLLAQTFSERLENEN